MAWEDFQQRTLAKDQPAPSWGRIEKEKTEQAKMLRMCLRQLFKTTRSSLFTGGTFLLKFEQFSWISYTIFFKFGRYQRPFKKEGKVPGTARDCHHWNTHN
jgi:hypothetical protein